MYDLSFRSQSESTRSHHYDDYLVQTLSYPSLFHLLYFTAKCSCISFCSLAKINEWKSMCLLFYNTDNLKHKWSCQDFFILSPLLAHVSFTTLEICHWLVNPSGNRCTFLLTAFITLGFTLSQSAKLPHIRKKCGLHEENKRTFFFNFNVKFFTSVILRFPLLVIKILSTYIRLYSLVFSRKKLSALVPRQMSHKLK